MCIRDSGYLLQQFLSPYTNKREDEYGGSFENRLRMITEIINGIRVQCGPDFPIGVRSVSYTHLYHSEIVFGLKTILWLKSLESYIKAASRNPERCV